MNCPEFLDLTHALAHNLALDPTPTKVAGVPSWFRQGFYGGLGLALLIGLFLIWLWQPERQVNRHTENFLRTIEKRNWTGVADFIGNDYQDQWGDDRARVLERMREVLRYLRRIRIDATNAAVRVDNQRGYWNAKITIDGDQGEVMALVKERVNSLATPFELSGAVSLQSRGIGSWFGSAMQASKFLESRKGDFQIGRSVWKPPLLLSQQHAHKNQTSFEWGPVLIQCFRGWSRPALLRRPLCQKSPALRHPRRPIRSRHRRRGV